MNMKAMAMLLLFLVFFGMVAATCSATVVSPPQSIQLEGGAEDNTGNWTGGYWTFSCAVDQADSLVGRVVLPANTSITGKGDAGSEIRTNETVEIQIVPTKAYYKRLLELAPIEDRYVAPRVYKGGMTLGTTGWYDKSKSIDPTIVDYYVFAESGWQKYTMFNVSVYVEGNKVGEQSFNTEAGNNDMMINTTKGPILIKNLGRLEGDYSEPHVPDAVIFNDKYIYDTDVIQYICYDHGRQKHYWGSDNSMAYYIDNSQAFSTYWFGNVRWNPKSSDSAVADTPAPFNTPDWGGYSVIDIAKGWKDSDHAIWDAAREPVQPTMTDILGYLNRMSSIGNKASNWITGYDGWHIETKDGKPEAVIVDCPWGAYSGTPLVTFYIPAELADTWIYRPAISDVRIQNAKWVNGSEIEAAENATCQLELKQYAKVLSSATIYAETSTMNASVVPTSTTVTLAPNITEIVKFDLANLGVTSDSSGTVMFTVKRTWDGVTTSVSQLSFTLLKPVVPDNASTIPDRPNQLNSTEPTKPSTVSEYPWWTIVLVIACTAMALTIVAMRRKYKKVGLYDVYKKDVGEDLITKAVGVTKDGYRVTRKVTREGLHLLGFQGKRMEALKVLVSGIVIGGIGFLWMNMAGTIAIVAPWIPQGFTIPLAFGLGIPIGFYIVPIFVGAWFGLSGLHDLIKS